MSTFKPTRAELRRIQKLATACEIDSKVAARLRDAGRPQSLASEAAARCSTYAFRLAEAVARRGGSA